MKNQTVIITGGSSGLGKAMAKKLVQEEANVVITGRNIDRLAEAKEELEKEKTGSVFTIQMDVRNGDDVQRMVDETVERYGTIDHLVNNAAGNFICAAEDLSHNGWNSVIDIVLNGTFYCSQAVGKYWIENKIKGSLLNIVAAYAWDAAVGVIHSGAAKAGVLNLTRTLAVEWGSKYGIRANAIAPGPIENTGGSDRLFQSDEIVRKTRESVPLNRFGQPEEIADLASFLLSKKAAYINGEVVTLDGGQHLNKNPF